MLLIYPRGRYVIFLDLIANRFNYCAVPILIRINIFLVPFDNRRTADSGKIAGYSTENENNDKKVYYVFITVCLLHLVHKITFLARISRSLLHNHILKGN